MDESRTNSGYLAPALAGGIAGMAVDALMYPLDTIKTRLQSKDGFRQTGGFKNIYKGLITQTMGSMPIYAVYFLCYEPCKATLLSLLPAQCAPLSYVVAASVSEVCSCLVKVPVEIVKKRKQTFMEGKRSAVSILVQAYRIEGMRRGLYRGFLSAVIRDTPFSLIEMPVWELLKTLVALHNDGHVTTLQSAGCGAIGCLVAATMTTPIDVATTRIMLANPGTSKHSLRVSTVLTSVYYSAGLRGLWSGVLPRASASAVGGFAFFGIYENIKSKIEVVIF